MIRIKVVQFTGGGDKPFIGVIQDNKVNPKIRSHADHLTMNSGDSIEYIFPDYGCTQDRAVNTPDSLPDNYNMSGFVNNIESSLVMTNLTSGSLYKIFLSIYMWSDKVGDYVKVKEGSIISFYEEGISMIPPIISGNFSIFISFRNLNVKYNKNVDNRFKVKIDNNGDSSEFDIITSFGIEDLKEDGL